MLAYSEGGRNSFEERHDANECDVITTLLLNISVKSTLRLFAYKSG